jgi:hypothetical protein
MTENAASSTPTVREALNLFCRTSGNVDHLVTAILGVNPDMPVETLKRRLLWGERVERSNQGTTFIYATEYQDWLTKPENPPSSVSNPRTTMRDIALSGSLQSSQENPPSPSSEAS